MEETKCVKCGQELCEDCTCEDNEKVCKDCCDSDKKEETEEIECGCVGCHGCDHKETDDEEVE